MDQNLRDNYHENQDFIDRKAGFIERMFDKIFFAAQRDVKITFIVILVISNGATFYLYTRSLESRLIDNQEYSEKIIQEVRRTIIPEINREVDRKTEKIETKVDSASSTLNEIKDAVSRSIQENLP